MNSETAMRYLPWPPSLKSRIIGIVLVMFVSSFWLLTFAIGKRLEQDMLALLQAQQSSAISYIAAELDAKITQRIELLKQNAELVTDHLDSPKKLREFLKGRIGLQALFQAGLVVIDKNGKGIADYPVADSRGEASFAELEYFQEALSSGKTVIGKPRIGRFTRKPGVAIATPIRDHSGQIIAVLTGFATLSDKNLFGQIEHGMSGSTGWIVVNSPRHRLIVSSSEPADILQAIPATDSESGLHNTPAEAEGTRLTMTHKGVQALVSTRHIPSAGWTVHMALPTAEAFLPIRNMIAQAYGIALALTALTLLATFIFIRRALNPLEDTTSSIRAMALDNAKLHLLEVSGNTEIQNLQKGFNALVQLRRQAEEAVRESEARFSRAELASKSGSWELDLATKTISASDGAAKLYGMTGNADALTTIQKAALAEYRPLLDAALNNLIENNTPYDVEFKIRTADTGEIRAIHSTAIFDKEKGIVLGVIQDISERSRIQQALAIEATRRRILFEQSRDGITLLRTDGSIAEFNPAFAEMLGYPHDELALMNVWDWDILLSQDQFKELSRDFGLRHLLIETRHQRKDGSQYDVEVSISGVEWAGEHYQFCMHRDITERKQAAAKLLASETRLRTIIDNEPECIKIVDAQGRLIEMNPAGLAMVEADSLEQVTGHEILELVAPECRATFAELHRKVIAGETTQAEFEIIGLKGGRRWLETHAVPMQDHEQTVHLAVTRDVTERKQSEEKLQLAASVFSHSREGILITSADGTIIDVNEAFSRITGYSREEVLGQNPRMLNSGRQAADYFATLWRELNEHGYWSGELWNCRKNGELYAEMMTISAVRDAQGQTQHYVALFSDITEIKKHQRELERMAHYDTLTSLPNRVLLADRLQQAMTQAVRRKQQLAVCYLDLDGFKAINDCFGHDTGDQLLIAAAARMKQALRESDTLARIGGDEFVAVLIDLQDDNSSVSMLERLLEAAAQPVTIATNAHQVSASLGVTFYPQQDDIGADQLLRQADQAMYQAKLAGKNRYQFFEAGKLASPGDGQLKNDL